MIVKKSDHVGPVKVTVTIPETGEVIKEQIVRDDYMIICNGNRYVKSYQIWGETHQINIARMKPGESE
jgi:hypothetical protein